ncbi:AprI/Inh family metalloprotease inhibitor [Methylobacterium sp.]|uniref:AprI/Inh family metalloprotease inhibitor n=1 Tax=Methylobacterium sp. TaxID=409 RepID=UPI0025EE1064|nr:AprI/Inh family metalloprotease inhibitor [Methylobacterium sp.]MBY0259111.1 protease inhibitor Inh/omp19 family protein [Methylobacterium sp.]
MPRSLLSTAAILALAAGLGACASQRFDGPVRGRAAPGPQAFLEPIAPAMPSGPVTSAPLAPPPGATAAPADFSPPVGADVAVAPATPVIASEPAPAIAPAAPPPPPIVSSGRSSVVGTWNAKDATGASCKVSLSSAPALDLYKASASGCPNKDLAKVTAWDYRDGEVYLYQPGGTVTARLRQGGGALDGALSKSGASLAMVR